MIHVTTKIGQPGKQERERRHFPDLFNKPCIINSPKLTGRKCIPHKIMGREEEWRPHNKSIDVEYTESGPDWSSKLKYIPAPENPDYPASEIWPSNWKAMRPFPYTYKRSENEWLFCPGVARIGLKCLFDGVHKATETSDAEITNSVMYSSKRYENKINKRNLLPEASPGDKSYQVPEYEPNFFRSSTEDILPKFCTGTNPFLSPRKKRADTFVPLVSMPTFKRETFREKMEHLRAKDEVDEVRRLELWHPARSIYTTIPQLDQLEFRKY